MNNDPKYTEVDMSKLLKSHNQDWMKEFEFDPDALNRIAKVIYQHPLSLRDCADILEIAAPMCTVMTVSGFKKLLREMINITHKD